MPAKWHATSINAAFLSLFLILTALVASGSGAAIGCLVDIAMSSGTTTCGDGDRLLFAGVLPDGRVRLNDEEVETVKLEAV